MAKQSLVAGTTSKSVGIFIQDSSQVNGAGLTGLAFNTASLVAYYWQPGGTSTAITLATLAAVNSAYSSGGFKEVDATNMPGVYRLDIPDAALTGATSVIIMLKGAANMAPVVLEIELTAVNNQDAVRYGMTALPNAAAEAAGGLYTRGSGAGQINQPANGQIDANVVAFAAATGHQPIRANTAQAGAAGTITLDASASAVDDFYLSAIVYITGGTGIGQARFITDYVGSSKVASISPNWATNPDNTSTFAILPVASVLDNIVEGAYTMRQMARGWASAMLGKSSGLATATAVYRDTGDSVDRITATVDSFGDRSAVTLDLT